MADQKLAENEAVVVPSTLNKKRKHKRNAKPKSPRDAESTDAIVSEMETIVKGIERLEHLNLRSKPSRLLPEFNSVSTRLSIVGQRFGVQTNVYSDCITRKSLFLRELVPKVNFTHGTTYRDEVGQRVVASYISVELTPKRPLAFSIRVESDWDITVEFPIGKDMIKAECHNDVVVNSVHLQEFRTALNVPETLKSDDLFRFFCFWARHDGKTDGYDVVELWEDFFSDDDTALQYLPGDVWRTIQTILPHDILPPVLLKLVGESLQ